MSDTVDVSSLDRQNGTRSVGFWAREGRARRGGIRRQDARHRSGSPRTSSSTSPGCSSCPTGATLELTLINDDKNTHCAVLPSNGDTQFIWLVNHSKGTATLELDGPGYYWYGSRTGNDEGRGLTGAIVVAGTTPPEAAPRPPAPAAAVVDRPAQPQLERSSRWQLST